MTAASTILRRMAARRQRERNRSGINGDVCHKGPPTERWPPRREKRLPRPSETKPLVHETTPEPDNRLTFESLVKAVCETFREYRPEVLRPEDFRFRVLAIRDTPPAGHRWWPRKGGPPAKATYVLLENRAVSGTVRTWHQLLPGALERKPELKALVEDFQRCER